jgi:hypothetical protein
MPQLELAHVAMPRAGGGAGQTIPHPPQFIVSRVVSLQPFGQLVWPVGHVAQSVPEVLQPLGQVIVAAMHIPVALQVPCSVTTPPEHDCGGPHCAPAPLFPLSTQTDEPVEQDVTPVLHGLVGWQG